MLLGIHIPLRLDIYTNLLIGVGTNDAMFVGFKGALDGSGKATASVIVPKNMGILKGLTFYHAYFVFDPKTLLLLTASNPVTAELK